MQKPSAYIKKPLTTTFEIMKDTGKTTEVVVESKDGKTPPTTKIVPVLLTGQSAMIAAKTMANEMGYSHVSMQQEDAEKFEFLAYNR